MYELIASEKHIGLIRVSTGKQYESGLGLEAQRDAIEAYSARTQSRLLKIYVEVESGKHDDIENRPVLGSALSHCTRANAILVVAKLDRLTRSLSIYADIKKRGVPVIALDIPDASVLTTEIMVVVKSEERRAISSRTKDALAAYKTHNKISKRIKLLHPDGVPAEIAEALRGKLGASLPQCRNLTPEGRAKGLARSAKNRRKKAVEAYSGLAEYMQELRSQGLTFLAIAERLNDDGHTTRHDKEWNPVQVWRIINRSIKAGV
jgi:DNA invertase Pin-like site-specific DNA recombinase